MQTEWVTETHPSQDTWKRAIESTSKSLSVRTSGVPAGDEEEEKGGHDSTGVRSPPGVFFGVGGPGSLGAFVSTCSIPTAGEQMGASVLLH